MKTSKFYFPGLGSFPGENEMLSWFGNIATELDDSFLNVDQKKILRAYYQDAGILRPQKTAYFRAHYGRSLAFALAHLFGAKPRPRILDLGCGMGTQSLLFALLGADVVGVDLDDRSLSILEARKSFYEKQTGRSLSLKYFQADAFKFDYVAEGPFDGIWSLFAFNMMQPSRDLLCRILPAAAPGCRFGVMDGNRLHWGRHLRKKPFSSIPALSPLEFAQEMSQHSFLVLAQHSGVGFPPAAWRVLPFVVLRSIEEMLDGHWRFPVSHLILAEKVPTRS